MRAKDKPALYVYSQVAFREMTCCMLRPYSLNSLGTVTARGRGMYARHSALDVVGNLGIGHQPDGMMRHRMELFANASSGSGTVGCSLIDHRIGTLVYNEDFQ